VLVPVRCFTCGNLVADKFDEYQNRVKSGEEPAKILDSLGIERYCCRRMMLTTLETIQQVIPFYEAMYKRNIEIQSELE
jgi:DNA-directed RNA polymerase subunit N|tara:strand:- start:453 stop:689 length:237 start_codon:yes stop_codon:yes gene_type:complete